jgi:hypothetical protein
VAFPFGPTSWRHMPSLLPRIFSWGRLLLADWLSPGMACVTPVLRLCRSCRGQAAFGEATVGGVLSSSLSSGSPRWSRQPAAGTAGPLARAGPLDLVPWRFLGRQPADSAALGIPLKSSPRHKGMPIPMTNYSFGGGGKIILGPSKSSSILQSLRFSS